MNLNVWRMAAAGSALMLIVSFAGTQRIHLQTKPTGASVPYGGDMRENSSIQKRLLLLSLFCLTR